MDYCEAFLANFTNAAQIWLEYNIPHPSYFENFFSDNLNKTKLPQHYFIQPPNTSFVLAKHLISHLSKLCTVK